MQRAAPVPTRHPHWLAAPPTRPADIGGRTTRALRQTAAAAQEPPDRTAPAAHTPQQQSNARTPSRAGFFRFPALPRRAPAGGGRSPNAPRRRGAAATPPRAQSSRSGLIPPPSLRAAEAASRPHPLPEPAQSWNLRQRRARPTLRRRSGAAQVARKTTFDDAFSAGSTLYVPVLEIQ